MLRKKLTFTTVVFLLFFPALGIAEKKPSIDFKQLYDKQLKAIEITKKAVGFLDHHREDFTEEDKKDFDQGTAKLVAEMEIGLFTLGRLSKDPRNLPLVINFSIISKGLIARTAYLSIFTMAWGVQKGSNEFIDTSYKLLDASTMFFDIATEVDDYLLLFMDTSESQDSGDRFL